MPALRTTRKAGLIANEKAVNPSPEKSSASSAEGNETHPEVCSQRNTKTPSTGVVDGGLQSTQSVLLDLARTTESLASPDPTAIQPPSPPKWPRSPAPTKVKKRRSALLDFLTVKEPSRRALEEYETQLKKDKGQQAVSPVGMSMVSSRKLPAHVPKVNSKWDGVPEKSTRKHQIGILSGSTFTGTLTEDASSMLTGTSRHVTHHAHSSRSWSFVDRDQESEDPFHDVHPQKSYDVFHTQASGSRPRTASSSASLKPHHAYAPALVDRESRLAQNAVRHVSNSKTQTPSLKTVEAAKSQPIYRSPDPPPPVPPAFLEDNSGSKYPNPLLRPKNSDGSLQTHAESVRESTYRVSRTPPPVLIQVHNSGPDVLQPPPLISGQREVQEQSSMESFRKPGQSISPRPILKTRISHSPVSPRPQPSISTQSPRPSGVLSPMIRPYKSMQKLVADPSNPSKSDIELNARKSTISKGKMLMAKLGTLRSRERK